MRLTTFSYPANIPAPVYYIHHGNRECRRTLCPNPFPTHIINRSLNQSTAYHFMNSFMQNKPGNFNGMSGVPAFFHQYGQWCLPSGALAPSHLISSFTKSLYISIYPLFIHSSQRVCQFISRNWCAVFIKIIGTPIPFEGRVLVNFAVTGLG